MENGIGRIYIFISQWVKLYGSYNVNVKYRPKELFVYLKINF